MLYTITKEQVRKMILDDGIRPDNRKRTEIRPIWCDTHVLPRTHGSGLFKRGQTQVLSVATVGPAQRSADYRRHHMNRLKRDTCITTTSRLIP